MERSFIYLILIVLSNLLFQDATAEELKVTLRTRVEDLQRSGLYNLKLRDEKWQPEKTAIIVCDMWDKHWCQGASARVAEMAPHMQKFLATAREQGVFIIHAPSGCMKPYESTAARERAKSAPPAANLPKDIAAWCKVIPAEERGVYPIDQSDGGCDCQPKCKTFNAWSKQYDGLKIDDADAVSDSGVEIWNLLESRQIQNVMLVGVHTNMCVLGRPFGLRQLGKNNKNVALVRDLTDTMYNHAAWPYVNHFRGNDLIVEHIEKYVAPTLTSEQLLGGKPFRFQAARTPHVVFVIGEDEYETKTTLPAFAKADLEPWGVRCTFIHAEEKNPNHFPGLEVLEEADLLVLSVRRRTPPIAQLEQVRRYLNTGKPLVGIRTASHAFSLRNNQPPKEGYGAWLEFDQLVLGGNYKGHYGVKPQQENGVITLLPAMQKHPLLAGVTAKSFSTQGSIYKNEPLQTGTELLMTGVATNEKVTEPIAWTHMYGKTKVAYTSLGHTSDFEQPAFRKFLSNAIYWAMEK
jgi:type 1 glutamine amidotransferase/nicotinamidase-related amidase